MTKDRSSRILKPVFLIALIMIGILITIVATVDLDVPTQLESDLSGQSRLPSAQQSAQENRPFQKSERRHRTSSSSELTPDDDPGILGIVTQIKSLELMRTTFCRETDSEDKRIETFLLKYPSPEEETEIMNLISEAKGLTRDDNRRIVTWKERLTREHLWPSRFEHCIITTEYFKKTGRGDYTVLGVPKGQLLMREGNSPISADGSIYVLNSALSFSYDSPWRFSHLFEIEEETIDADAWPRGANKTQN